MSTKKERIAIQKMALQEWDTIAIILAERGETYLNTDPSQWGAGLNLAMARAKALVDVCVIIGVTEIRSISDLYDLHNRTRNTR